MARPMTSRRRRMARATGKVGSMTPSEAADGDLASGSGGGRHNARAVGVARERQREKDLCLDR